MPHLETYFERENVCTKNRVEHILVLLLQSGEAVAVLIQVALGRGGWWLWDVSFSSPSGSL